jgi:hypothetical protein
MAACSSAFPQRDRAGQCNSKYEPTKKAAPARYLTSIESTSQRAFVSSVAASDAAHRHQHGQDAGAVKAAALLDAPLTNVIAPHRTGALSLSLLRWLCLPVHPWL